MDDPQVTQHEDESLRESQPNASGPRAAAGGMGVSSEREGHTGPDQYATDGIKDTSAIDEPLDGTVPSDGTEDASDESAATGRDRLRASGEPRPEGLDPAAGYPSLDPRSEDKPYKDA